jgi:hypothetical protein
MALIGSDLYYRSKGERYKDIVENLQPNVIFEDDCKSIGGAWQMCITRVDPQIKKKIVSIVVKEFAGIDDLPQNISAFNQKL